MLTLQHDCCSGLPLQCRRRFSQEALYPSHIHSDQFWTRIKYALQILQPFTKHWLKHFRGACLHSDCPLGGCFFSTLLVLPDGQTSEMFGSLRSRFRSTQAVTLYIDLRVPFALNVMRSGQVYTELQLQYNLSIPIFAMPYFWSSPLGETCFGPNGLLH